MCFGGMSWWNGIARRAVSILPGVILRLGVLLRRENDPMTCCLDVESTVWRVCFAPLVFPCSFRLYVVLLILLILLTLLMSVRLFRVTALRLINPLVVWDVWHEG
jgi:hypothetical protein